MALKGYGGMFTVLQNELVDRRRWITAEVFLEESAAAQVMPGPNACNLALAIGSRFFGWRGALASLLGLLAAPVALVLVLALAYGSFQEMPAVRGALRGMTAVAAGAIIASGVKLVPALRKHRLGRYPAFLIAGTTFGLITMAKMPMVLVLGLVGGLACVLTWHALKS